MAYCTKCGRYLPTGGQCVCTQAAPSQYFYAQSQPQYMKMRQEQVQPQNPMPVQPQSPYYAQSQSQVQVQNPMPIQAQSPMQTAVSYSGETAAKKKKGRLVGGILGGMFGAALAVVIVSLLFSGESGRHGGTESSGYSSGSTSGNNYGKDQGNSSDSLYNGFSDNSSGNLSGGTSDNSSGGSSGSSTAENPVPTEPAEPKRGTVSFKNWARSHPEICEISTDTDYVWVEEEDPAMYAVYECIAPPDDEYDFMFASDYYASMFGYNMYDSCGYETAFGIPKPTLQDLYDAVDRNPNIISEYKKMIKEYVHDWLTLWPESDFTILYLNLETLVVEEMSESEIQKAALSPNSVACYVNRENKICLNENGNFSDKTSKDYIVFIHELTHAARTRVGKLNGKDLYVRFYDKLFFGLYEDEMLDTWFCYRIQGLNRKSEFYTFTSNIYRGLMDVIDYDGADYMNHSINYFMKCIQDYFDKIGFDMPAYRFITLVNARMEYHYDDVNSVGYNNYSDMFRAVIYSWGYNYLKPGMTDAEIEKVFRDLYDDLTYNFDRLSKTYDEVTEDYLRYFWDECLDKNGWR